MQIRDIVRSALPAKVLHGYRVVRHLWLFPFERELSLIPGYLDRQRVAIDVGANVGLMSSVLARGSKRVIAFEPHPDCARHLRRIAIRNCEVVEVAASDRNGSVALRVPGTHALATIEATNELSKETTVTEFAVTMQTIDSALASRLDANETVGFIKIDVEGHEYAVLKGAGATLEKHRPALMIEIEFRHNLQVVKTFNLLAGYGYRPFITFDGSRLVTIKPDDLHDLQAAQHPSPRINNVFFLHEPDI